MFDVLVLDAMGVIYSSKDDVEELLIPFIRARGGASAKTIEHCYQSASMGDLSAEDFWYRVGLSPEVEDEYLESFTLTPGLMEFLDRMVKSEIPVMALTNDVSRWSTKLRKKFGLEKSIRHWVVSGDVCVRKPDPLIYDALIKNSEKGEEGIYLFVDDRIKNLDTAYQKGWKTVLFRPERDAETEHHATACDFQELWKLIR